MPAQKCWSREGTDPPTDRAVLIAFVPYEIVPVGTRDKTDIARCVQSAEIPGLRSAGRARGASDG
jgi:hypothetical protein